jgi:hypothetical protein
VFYVWFDAPIGCVPSATAQGQQLGPERETVPRTGDKTLAVNLDSALIPSSPAAGGCRGVELVSCLRACLTSNSKPNLSWMWHNSDFTRPREAVSEQYDNPARDSLLDPLLARNTDRGKVELHHVQCSISIPQ